MMNILERVRSRKGIAESLSNIGWLSGDRFIRMFGAVLVGTLVARYLGPTRFGFLNYGISSLCIARECRSSAGNCIPSASANRLSPLAISQRCVLNCLWELPNHF